MVIQKQIPSLQQFIYPSNEMKIAIEELLKYYQLQNQKSVFLYEKWKDTESFKGNMEDYDKVLEMKELYQKAQGKEWEPLLQTLILRDAYTDELNFKDFAKLNHSQQQDVIEIISSGQKAFQKITKWIEPINKKKVLSAIYSAINIKIGNDEYDQFQVLKYADLKTIPNKFNSVSIFPYLLEIDDPPALVQYFKLQKDPIHDCLILGFMRGKTAYKPTIYLFLVWNNALYVISFSDKRLNLENVAGSRDPDRYKERVFGQIWLPLEIFFGEKNQSKSTDLLVRNQKIFKRGKMSDIFADEPESKAWLDMFTYRLLDFVKNPTSNIPQAMIPKDIIKMLTDESDKKIETRIKTDRHYSSFHSQNDASSYLLKKYSSNITSVVLSESDYPILIGTKDYIEGVVKYKQRIKIADSLESLNYKDWRKNHSRVYKQFRKFVESQNIIEFVKQALQNKKYPKMYYPSMGKEVYYGGKNIKLKEPKVLGDTILKVESIYDKYFEWYHDYDPLEINWTPRGVTYENAKHVNCQICKKFKHSMLLTITFQDYRQILAFYNITEDKLPKQFIEHLHFQNEAYIGNPRLDDTDPVDEVKDFWFRPVVKHQLGEWKNTNHYFPSGQPHMKIHVPLCKRCLKKYGEKK